MALELNELVTPELRRAAGSMFSRMRRKGRDTAEVVAHKALKPITNGSGTKVHVTAGADRYFLYTQGAAATVWTVTHNFGRFPNVMIMDNAGAEMDALVEHTDNMELTITFNTAQDGQAALS